MNMDGVVLHLRRVEGEEKGPVMVDRLSRSTPVPGATTLLSYTRSRFPAPLNHPQLLPKARCRAASTQGIGRALRRAHRLDPQSQAIS